MPHDEWASCPHCYQQAFGRKEIEELFGYRYDNTTPQSWCRECRTKQLKEKNCSYTECPFWGEDDCSTNHDCLCEDD